MNKSYRLWSLWDMLRTYLPLYQIGLRLEALRSKADSYRESEVSLYAHHSKEFSALVKEMHQECLEHDFTHTADFAKRVANKPPPEDYGEIFYALEHLNDLLSHELDNEAVVRIPPERKDYFEQNDLFGLKVAAAFPSCAGDIKKAGSCYALEQADACVHHAMLVLERGLHALAAKVAVPYQAANWQLIIDQIKKRLDSLPRGPERDFYNEVNAQFGFLKVAYRNHSEHTRDDSYDMPKALHIFNHVRAFMQELQKGGLSE